MYDIETLFLWCCCGFFFCKRNIRTETTATTTSARVIKSRSRSRRVPSQQEHGYIRRRGKFGIRRQSVASLMVHGTIDLIKGQIFAKSHLFIPGIYSSLFIEGKLTSLV